MRMIQRDKMNIHQLNQLKMQLQIRLKRLFDEKRGNPKFNPQIQTEQTTSLNKPMQIPSKINKKKPILTDMDGVSQNQMKQGEKSTFKQKKQLTLQNIDEEPSSPFGPRVQWRMSPISRQAIQIKPIQNEDFSSSSSIMKSYQEFLDDRRPKTTSYAQQCKQRKISAQIDSPSNKKNTPKDKFFLQTHSQSPSSPKSTQQPRRQKLQSITPNARGHMPKSPFTGKYSHTTLSCLHSNKYLCPNQNAYPIQYNNGQDVCKSTHTVQQLNNKYSLLQKRLQNITQQFAKESHEKHNIPQSNANQQSKVLNLYRKHSPIFKLFSINQKLKNASLQRHIDEGG